MAVGKNSRLSDDFLSELRFRNPIEDVISSYVELKQSGNTLKGLCPFHNEKTPSFTVYPATASYYCFGCQNGGDVVTFMRQIENLDYMESVKLLADRAGLSMPESSYDNSGEILRKKIYAINRETARFYHACLMDPKIGARGYKYFKERAVSDEFMTHFGLGYAPDSGFALCNFLRKKGYSESDLIIANVAGKSKSGHIYDRFRGKMMFPVIDLRGNVIAFGGRKFPGEEGGKYINTSDTPVYKKSRNLYALNFAKNSKSDSIILCEGYMDVISLHQAGFTNAVAALGTSFTDEMAGLLSRYAKEVIVTMDSDGPGQKASRRAIGIISKTGIKIRVLNIEGGKDPDEYIKAYGPERFKLLLDGAKNDIEFQLLQAKNKYDLSSADGLLQYSEEAVNILATVNNEIAVNLYAGNLADEIKVNRSVLLTQISHKRDMLRKNRDKKMARELIAPRVSNNGPNPEAKLHRRASVAEENILTMIMQNHDLMTICKINLDENDFVTDFNKRLYKSICEIYENGDFSIGALSDEYLPDEMGKISQMYNTGIGGDEKALADCIAVLKEENQKSVQPDAKDLSDDQFGELFSKLKKEKK